MYVDTFYLTLVAVLLFVLLFWGASSTFLCRSYKHSATREKGLSRFFQEQYREWRGHATALQDKLDNVRSCLENGDVSQLSDYPKDSANLHWEDAERE